MNRSVIPTDEGLVGGLEFRCAKEGLCTMEDVKSMEDWLWRPTLKCCLPKKDHCCL